MIQLLLYTFLALVVAVAIAEYWREQIADVRRDLAQAQHDNDVLAAELVACGDTRRDLGAWLEEERRLARLQATRGGP